MVMLQSQPEAVWASVREQLQLEKKLEGLSLRERFDLLRPVVTGARTGIGDLPASAPVSFKVSYVGRTDWGSMTNMIESVHCSVTTDGSGICIEINTCNGYFDYCFMQEFEDDRYVNAFVDLLDTGERELREGNRWRDLYWGVDLKTGEDENHLGKLHRPGEN